MGKTVISRCLDRSAKTFVRRQFCSLRLGKSTADIEGVKIRKRRIGQGVDPTEAEHPLFERLQIIRVVELKSRIPNNPDYRALIFSRIAAGRRQLLPEYPGFGLRAISQSAQDPGISRRPPLPKPDRTLPSGCSWKGVSPICRSGNSPFLLSGYSTDDRNTAALLNGLPDNRFMPAR